MTDEATTIHEQPRQEKRTKATARKHSIATKPVAPYNYPAGSSGEPAVAQSGEGIDGYQHVQGSQEPRTPGAASDAPGEEGQQGVQAAQLAANVETPQDPPLDPLTTALSMLTQQGMPEAKAKAALQTVSAAGKSLEEWALSAIEWQTAQDDLEAEKNELEQAMQASLRQEEERKSQQTPLEQQTPEQLLGHFKGSMLLAALRGTSLEDQLFLEPLLLPVLRLLKLEQQSLKWYSSGGTRRYFEALAQECAASVSCLGSSAAAEAPPSASKRESKRRKKDAASNGDSKAAEASAAEGPSHAPEECNGSSSADVNPFGGFLHAKAAALETGLYQMPGTSGEVPAIFLDDTPDDEVEAGDVMEDDNNNPEQAEAEEEAVILD